jgi:hypothetical protein
VIGLLIARGPEDPLGLDWLVKHVRVARVALALRASLRTPEPYTVPNSLRGDRRTLRLGRSARRRNRVPQHQSDPSSSEGFRPEF